MFSFVNVYTPYALLLSKLQSPVIGISLLKSLYISCISDLISSISSSKSELFLLIGLLLFFNSLSVFDTLSLSSFDVILSLVFLIASIRDLLLDKGIIETCSSQLLLLSNTTGVLPFNFSKIGLEFLIAVSNSSSSTILKS